MRFLLVFLGVLAITPIAAFAAPYVPLEPLPFVKATSGALSFADLLNGFFQLSLVLGAAITAVMLTVGGVQYMTSDAAGGKQQGKDRIRNAALGFLLLLSVYVIIKTINPDLLVFDLSRITDVGCQQGQCVAKNTPTGRTIESHLRIDERGQIRVGDGVGESQNPNAYVLTVASDIDSRTGKVEFKSYYFIDGGGKTARERCESFFKTTAAQGEVGRTMQMTRGVAPACTPNSPS